MFRFRNFILESKSESMVEELKDIENSPTFIEWLYELAGRQGVRQKIRKEDLLAGYCEDLAVYLHYKYGAELVAVDDRSINDGHYFVKINGKFYDVMNPEGVNKPSELVWSKRLMAENEEITPDKIDTLLRPLGIEWSGYETSKRVIK